MTFIDYFVATPSVAGSKSAKDYSVDGGHGAGQWRWVHGAWSVHVYYGNTDRTNYCGLSESH